MCFGACTQVDDNFLFGDGSVHFLKTGIAPGSYQYLMTIAGGEVISSDSY